MLNQNLFATLFPALQKKSLAVGGDSFVPDDEQDSAPATAMQPAAPLFIPPAPGFKPQMNDEAAAPQDPYAEEGADPNQVFTSAPVTEQADQTAASAQLPAAEAPAERPPMEEQARTALSMIAKAPENSPGADKKAKRDAARPQFVPPNANPTTEEERAENDLAKAQWDAENATNQDHGVKGFLKEALQNFFEGLSRTPQGANAKQALLLGGVGAGAGMLGRGWNERRAAAASIPGLQRRVATARQGAENRIKIRNEQNQIQNRDIQTQLNIAKYDQDKITDAQSPYLKQWADMDNFDPVNNPAHKKFAEDAAKAGVTLIPKEKGSRYTATVAPNGNVVVVNTSTGEYKVGNESLAKPKEFKDEDINPSEFGLKSDNEIKNMATARIAPSLKDRTVRPDVLANLPPEYKNPDGSFNEAAYLSDANLGISKLNSSDIYQNLPDDYKQREAQEIARVAKSQGGLKKSVDRFRSILNHRTPNPNAEPMTLDEVKQYFKKALQSSPKELEEFFKIIQHANIQ